MTNNSTVRSQKTATLVECALLVAMAAALSFIKVYPLPFGGSVTIGSMVPILLIAYRRGLRWGLLSGFVFGLFRFIIGFEPMPALSLIAVLMSILLDYLLAYTVLGFAGAFKAKFKHPANEFALGALIALLLRYLMHIISGFLFFSDYAEWFFGETGAFGQTVLANMGGATLSIVYSVIYNATFMVPEIVISIALCYLISLIPSVLAPKDAQA